MYVNIIIYSNKLLLFVWSTLKKEKKKKIIINHYHSLSFVTTFFCSEDMFPPRFQKRSLDFCKKIFLKISLSEFLPSHPYRDLLQ